MHVPKYTTTMPLCHHPLQVDVYIYEPKGISTVQVPNSLGHQFEDLIRVTSTKDKVRQNLWTKSLTVVVFYLFGNSSFSLC